MAWIRIDTLLCCLYYLIIIDTLLCHLYYLLLKVLSVRTPWKDELGTLKIDIGVAVCSTNHLNSMTACPQYKQVTSISFVMQLFHSIYYTVRPYDFAEHKQCNHFVKYNSI